MGNTLKTNNDKLESKRRSIIYSTLPTNEIPEGIKNPPLLEHKKTPEATKQHPQLQNLKSHQKQHDENQSPC